MSWINNPEDGWTPLVGLEGRVWWRHQRDCTQFQDAHGMFLFFLDVALTAQELAHMAKAMASGIMIGEQTAQARVRAALGIPWQP